MRAFRTISELNPQLEQQLAILKVSPAFLRGLFIFRKDLEMDIKKEIIGALQTFHEDPDGQQILMLLKEERLISFKPEYLVTARNLFEEYQRIQFGKTKNIQNNK
jgi:phosphonate transport system substrate-binding protein